MPRASRQRGRAARALSWSAAAALLAISAWRWLSLGDGAEPLVPPWPEPAASRATAALATLRAGGAFEDHRPALERPLFHPTRRPLPDRKTLIALANAAKAKPAPSPPPPSPPPPVAAPPPQGFQLRGTVIAGPLPSAVFERAGRAGYVRLREGEQLEGWTLVKIGRAEVVLRLGEQTVTFPLAKGR